MTAARLLLIDDDLRLAAMVGDYLRAAGYDRPFMDVETGVPAYLDWLAARA